MAPNGTQPPHFARGSEWRKWDLHVHTKGTAKNDQFRSSTFDEFCIVFFKAALERDIAAIGVTDYYSIENYKKCKEFVTRIDEIAEFSKEEKERIKSIFLLPNVELRMVPVTEKGRLVNIHCLFNPDFVESLENNFFASVEHAAGTGKRLKMNRQGLIDLGKSVEPKLDDRAAYAKGVTTFVVTHESLQKLKDENKDFKENVIIAVSNSSKDGASGIQKHYDFFEGSPDSSLDELRKALYRISDCLFSANPRDSEYFVGKGKDDPIMVARKCGSLKPCIHGSDAHDEDHLFEPDEGRYCWIKSDLTFNGLKQIIFEPDPSERVYIGPARPDQKDGFKVVKRIKFKGTMDFPEQIEFNQNLCSIIGSRSSGKSALLAYLADSIDSEQTRSKKGEGPGEGFRWGDVDFDYSVEWGSGKSSKEEPGKIVYIPQNYLYEMSGKPEEIKNKIKPVLTRKMPAFAAFYNQVEKSIRNHNSEISDYVSDWFENRELVDSYAEQLRELGSLTAVNTDKEKLEKKVSRIKTRHELNEEDLKKYQTISGVISTREERIETINGELRQLGEIGKDVGYFSNARVTLVPSQNDLPQPLKGQLDRAINKSKEALLAKANKLALDYKRQISEEKAVAEKEIRKTRRENKTLIEKYQKNQELESLVKRINKHDSTIKKINLANKGKKAAKDRLAECEKEIKSHIEKRMEEIAALKVEMLKADQSMLKEIKFDVEAELNRAGFEKMQQKINLKETTDFVSKYKLKVDAVRKKPNSFLSSIYSGKQKITKGYDRPTVAIDVLTHTEEILFTAKMEGDKIGGFSETTMTPGKRALFAMRLLLAESDDTWPLLIDQPEDDLDSRSIYDDVVPFLREKKKERQIIMVSHNANLVIGADSEQIVVANRHGEDRRNQDGLQFNYLTGSIENTKIKVLRSQDTLHAQGIREHACEILDGGPVAFEKRGNKYNIVKG